MQELLVIMRRLRGPGGCPWDQEQSHESLRPYLLEEAAEAVDAVDSGDQMALASELGDVLLQVAFHSVIAEEQGTFTYADVEGHIVEKMVRRHPHVFGEVQVSGAAEVVTNWQAIKAAEQGGKPRKASEKIPAALGALARESQAQKLLSAQGLQLQGHRSAVQEAVSTAADTSEGVAEVLSAVVSWARTLGIDAEVALRSHTNQTLSEHVELDVSGA